MSEISETNMSNVTDVLGVSRISKKNKPGAQVNVLKKCRTSGAPAGCAQINELLNVLNIQNKYVLGVSGISEEKHP